MAPPADDDFDFAGLDSLELDLDEKALLAGTQNPYSQPSNLTATASGWNSSKGRSNRSITPPRSTSATSAHPFHLTDLGNSTGATRDEFEDFDDFGVDALMLDDNELLEESTSSTPVRSNFFAPNSTRQNIPQQQQQQHRPHGPAPAQPSKMFSIFGGAQNQDRSHTNTSGMQRASSNSLINTNSLHGVNSSLQIQGSNVNASAFFSNSGPSGSAPTGGPRPQQQLAPLFASHQGSNQIMSRADPSNDFATDTFISPETIAHASQPPTHHPIDTQACLTWQYPVNYPKRDYQYNIIRRALFTNTLVSLPTGLGKTFIAAVVMLNYFRWFPQSKIIFMAPTRPLVNQQIEACFNICGIPQEETIEMTGQMSSEVRQEMWRKRRVVFCTPQVLQNDIKCRTCPVEEIVCLVVDEAHRATGRYAYAEVIRMMEPINRDVRILALTATPGTDIKTVQLVVRNLKIGKIELRTEDSMDLQQYVFKRSIQEMIVPCGREVAVIRDKFQGFIRPFLERLVQRNVIRTADPGQLTRFALLTGQDTFLQNNIGPEHQKNKSIVMRQIAVAMGLVHAYELLTVHGIKPFFANMDPFSNSNINIIDKGAKSNKNKSQDDKPSLARKAMEGIPDFMRMMDGIRAKIKQQNFVSHPKIERLVGVVIQHFLDHQDDTDALVQSRAESAASTGTAVSADEPLPQTRVMIFANYRESVEEIGRVLECHRPLVKVQSFIGQASAKGKKGISQKEQQKVVADFQNGAHNVLVATSIGEEGLDIGDVDLIICYDSHASPIRMLQRMGRTGRKRQGKICLLLSEGQEEQKYRRAQTQYKSVQRAMSSGTQIQYCLNSPRILPQGPRPECEHVHIHVPAYIAPTGGRKRRKLDEDGTESTEPRKIAQGAFLDPLELARFQQRYRIPKREIRGISFEGSCAMVLVDKKRRSVLAPDKTYMIGHSTRTLNFINTVNRIAKARVEQSLAISKGLGGAKDQDAYSKRMMTLIERWGPSGTGAEESGSDSPSKPRSRPTPSNAAGIAKVGATRSLLSKKSNKPRPLDVRSDEDTDENSHRSDERSAGASPVRQIAFIDSDGTEEMGTDENGGDRELSDLATSLFGTTSTKQIRPKAKKMSRPGPISGSHRPRPGFSKTSGTLTSSTTATATKKPIASYLKAASSDDEIDKEIMEGFAGVFGYRGEDHGDDCGKGIGLHDSNLYQYNHDHHQDGYVPDATPDFEDRPVASTGAPKSSIQGTPSFLQTERGSESTTRACKGYDFQEPSADPSLWYKLDTSHEDEMREDAPLDMAHMMHNVGSFAMIKLPPVPPPGQWYQPQQGQNIVPEPIKSSSCSGNAAASIATERKRVVQDAIEANTRPNQEAEDLLDEKEEILFIESSQEESDVIAERAFGLAAFSKSSTSTSTSTLYNHQPTILNTTKAPKVLSSSRSPSSSLSELTNTGFVSARSLVLSGAHFKNPGQDRKRSKDRNSKKAKEKGKSKAVEVDGPGTEYGYGYGDLFGQDQQDCSSDKRSNQHDGAKSDYDSTGDRAATAGSDEDDIILVRDSRDRRGSSGIEDFEIGDFALADDDALLADELSWE